MNKNLTIAEELAARTNHANQKKEGDKRKQQLTAQLEQEKWNDGTSEQGIKLVEETVQKIIEKSRSEASKGNRETNLRLESIFATYNKSFWSSGKPVFTSIWGKRLINKLQEMGFGINLTHYKGLVDCGCSDCDGCVKEENIPHIIISW